MSPKFLFLVVTLLALTWYMLSDDSITPANGVLAYKDPIQSATTAGPFPYKDYIITPIASFDITARVLGKERYRFDKGADLAPIDFAMGWQAMSDSKILSAIDISQGGRFYHWYTSDFPIPRENIETQSANMHLVPSTKAIENQLDDIPVNGGVHIQGFLIQANRDDGFVWRSSTTRGDTGWGACELIWVTKAERTW